MAYSKIIFVPSPAGDLGIYAIIRARADGSVWNGAALGTFADGSLQSYVVSLDYVGGDAYGFTVPADLPAGSTYTVAFYQRTAGTSLETCNAIVSNSGWLTFAGSAVSANILAALNAAAGTNSITNTYTPGFDGTLGAYGEARPIVVGFTVAGVDANAIVRSITPTSINVGMVSAEAAAVRYNYYFLDHDGQPIAPSTNDFRDDGDSGTGTISVGLTGLSLTRTQLDAMAFHLDAQWTGAGNLGTNSIRAYSKLEFTIGYWVATVADSRVDEWEFLWTGTTASAPGGSEATPGQYADQGDIEDEFGEDNVRIWSQLDNTVETADLARIGAALVYADAEIDNAFRGGPYAVPLVLSDASATLTSWAARLAGIWLHRGRGQHDEGEDGDKYAEMEKAVREDMAQYVGGFKRFDAAHPFADMPSAPVVVA